MRMTGYDVVVVGAGVAGLIAALRSARSGRTVLVLDEADEPGGCVRFHRVGGLDLDRGAESFATARPAVAALAAQLALPVEAPLARTAWIYHRAGPAPIPAATLLGIPAHPAAADVRRVIGWPGAARAALDRLLPPGRAPQGLGELVRARLGSRVLNRLVAPVVAGVYSADPAGLDTEAVAPGLLHALGEAGSLTGAVQRLRGSGSPAGSAVAGISGGMGLLSRALAAAVEQAGGEIRCGARVSGLARAADGWAVAVRPPASEPAPGASGIAKGSEPRTASYPVETILADSAVVAIPAAGAAPLIVQATDGAVALPTTPATDVLIATLVVDEPLLDEAPRGTGLLVAPDVTDVAAKALTHATAKWAFLARRAGPHRHVLRLSYGRGGATPADSDFPDLALHDAARLLGVPLARRQLGDAATVRYSGQLAARRADQRAALERIPVQLQRFPGLALCGSAIAGTGLGAVVTNAATTPIGDVPPLGAGSNHDEQ